MAVLDVRAPRQDEALRETVGAIADRFRAVFERHVWGPFAERGMPADDVARLSSDVAQLTELATSVVTTELHQRFAAFASDYLAQASGSEERS